MESCPRRTVPRGQERRQGERGALRRPGTERIKRRRREMSSAGSNTIKGSRSQAIRKYVLNSLQKMDVPLRNSIIKALLFPF